MMLNSGHTESIPISHNGVANYNYNLYNNNINRIIVILIVTNTKSNSNTRSCILAIAANGCHSVKLSGPTGCCETDLLHGHGVG